MNKLPSLEVLACLKIITKLSIEENLHVGNSLAIINNLCRAIIAGHPNYELEDIDGDALKNLEYEKATIFRYFRVRA